ACTYIPDTSSKDLDTSSEDSIVTNTSKSELKQKLEFYKKKPL
ncbi:10416_t:CDS:1, partial [Dentiscutata heterogama]